MKAAIPTNDGLMMASSFEKAKGFLILNIELGKITREEIIWRKNGQLTESPENVTDVIKDCSAVIADGIAGPYKKVLERRKIAFIHSSDNIITNAIIHYLEHETGKAADTCCCP